MTPHENIPSAAPDPEAVAKLRLWQVTQLSAVRRLKANPDYALIIPPRLEAMKSHFHDSMCDITKTGEALEFARARYLSARALHSLLDNLESALADAVKRHSAEEPDPNTPPDVDKTIAFSYGGWFDSAVTPQPQPEQP